MRCRALTKDGTQCKNEALEGSEFCWIHQGYDGPLAPEGSTQVDAEEEEVLVKVEGRKTYKVRYLGRGSYWIAGYHFTTDRPVQEVPEEVAEILLDRESDLFEEAE